MRDELNRNSIVLVGCCVACDLTLLPSPVEDKMSYVKLCAACSDITIYLGLSWSVTAVVQKWKCGLREINSQLEVCISSV